MLVCAATGGCGSSRLALPYQPADNAFRAEVGMGELFAEDLCVVNTEIGDRLELSDSVRVGLFDLNQRKTLYAHRVNDRSDPASLTKLMTALVAVKYGQPDMRLTATEAVNITEEGAQKLGLKPGDSMTLDQALHVLLIYSANDVAMLIAEGIGGSVEGFVTLMNEEASRIGATQSHFCNPHGLTQEGHYVTAYDMYLIFNEVIRIPELSEIIGTQEYSTRYRNGSGDLKEISLKNTNQYLRGNAAPPAGVTIIGGKTGTTNAAGSCLILMAKDSSGNPYIAVILRAGGSAALYETMTELLMDIQSG
ncbi:MAG: D-alanyl-D-alanine carboxypeptidase [Butyrivibrio sp.]|nr:D-alanyl-D-alanine carboxypeptidase [Butyrivibrio sp.]